MANFAYLFGANDSTPAGFREEDGDFNHDYATQALASGGKYHIPLFWFTIFDESHIVRYPFLEFQVQTAVCHRAAAVALLERRRAQVLGAIPGVESAWDSWQRLITEAPFSYFKLNAHEIWDLDHDAFNADFPVAFRWFSSRSALDLDRLLGLAGIRLDPDDGCYKFWDSPLRGNFLHGYKALRDVPWEDDHD
jgi:hypothetical protein